MCKRLSAGAEIAEKARLSWCVKYHSMGGAEHMAQRLAEVLREEGFNVHIRSGGLVVSRGGVTAYVALSGAELPGAYKLLLRVGGEPGVSILECSDVSRVVCCVRRLVEMLREHV